MNGRAQGNRFRELNQPCMGCLASELGAALSNAPHIGGDLTTRSRTAPCSRAPPGPSARAPAPIPAAGVLAHPLCLLLGIVRLASSPAPVHRPPGGGELAPSRQ